MSRLPFKQASANTWREAAVVGSMEGLEVGIWVRGRPGCIVEETGFCFAVEQVEDVQMVLRTV